MPLNAKRDFPEEELLFWKKSAKVCPFPSMPLEDITPENKKEVMKTGAKGVCIMSSAMTCAEPDSYLAKLDSPK